MLRKIPILCLVLSLLFCVPVFAAPETEGAETSEPAVVEPVLSEEEIFLNQFKEEFNRKGVAPELAKQIYVIRAPKEVPVVLPEGENTEGETATPVPAPTEPVEEILYFGRFDSQVYFSVEDPEFKLWLDEMCADVARDAIKGLEELTVSKITIDYIRLDSWGEFLFNYYKEKISDIKSGDIVIEYGDYSFNIKNSAEAKEMLLNHIVPAFLETIVEEARKYPAKEYTLDIPNGSLLSEYELDLTQVKELRTVYPFDGVSTYSFSDMGDIFVLNLGKSYVDILRGYIEDGANNYNKRVEGPVPGCVNVLANIVLLRDVRNNTLNDKVLTDFTAYENLAVRLDTKGLVDINNVTTVKELYFGDYKLNFDNLLLMPIQDSTVVIQPTYLECFEYAGYDRNFGRTIDATSFITSGNPNFTYSYKVQTENGESVQTVEIPIERFCNENGILDTRLGRAPFLVYYDSYTPYDLLVDWGYNSGILTEEQQPIFIETIKNDMESQNRGDEFDAYVKAAGQMTDNTKTIIFAAIGGVVLIIAIVLFVIIRKKLKENDNPMNQRSVLFDDSDYDSDYDDDDDDFGSFELK